MKLSKRLLLARLLAICGLVWLGSYGCDQRTVAPKPDPEPPKDYITYFCNVGEPFQLFQYHAVTRQVDSTPISWSPVYGITVSADGTRLYGVEPDRIVVAEINSLSIVAELPYSPRRPVVVSPNGEYIAILGDSLCILLTSDYSVCFNRTGSFGGGAFSADSRSFYVPADWDAVSRGQVCKLDLSDSTIPITHYAFEDGGVVQVIPSNDETKLFLYMTVGMWTGAYEVYDVVEDSVTFREFLVPGAGRVATTPDGKFVFYNNPGANGVGPLEWPPRFTVFDIGSTDIHRVVSDSTFFADSGWVAHPNSMAVTPDNRWLVMLGGSLALRVLYLYDIQAGQLVHREAWGGSGHAFTGVTVQMSL